MVKSTALQIAEDVVPGIADLPGDEAERIDAGESVGDIATDYDLQQAEIEQAVVYERAA